MKVSEIGEFGLIARITGLIDRKSDKRQPSWKKLLIGAGDDSAAWETGYGVELATTDILVEGVHFNLEYTGWHDLGWKSLAANLSDIAAMGGSPAYALVSLALPGSVEIEGVIELYEGMLELANKYGVAISGGNISLADKIIINITVIGKAPGTKLLTRSAARPGDSVAITGYPGLSAAGLKVLANKLRVDTEAFNIFTHAHLRPVPRVLEANVLVQAGIKTAIDTSDGLVSDLVHICEASRVCATVLEPLLPLHPLLSKYFGAECMNLTLSGGEDFELIFTGEGKTIERLKEKLACPVAVIGEISAGNPGTVTVLDFNNKPFQVDYKGWDHYRTAR